MSDPNRIPRQSSQRGGYPERLVHDCIGRTRVVANVAEVRLRPRSHLFFRVGGASLLRPPCNDRESTVFTDRNKKSPDRNYWRDSRSRLRRMTYKYQQ